MLYLTAVFTVTSPRQGKDFNFGSKVTQPYGEQEAVLSFSLRGRRGGQTFKVLKTSDGSHSPAVFLSRYQGVSPAAVEAERNSEA